MIRFNCTICRKIRRTRNEVTATAHACARHFKGNKSNRQIMDRVRKVKTIKKVTAPVKIERRRKSA